MNVVHYAASMELFLVLAVITHHASSAPDFSDYLHKILKNHTAHACNGETLSIRCPTRTSVAVLSAFYGRRVPSQYLCPHAIPNTTVESTDCISTTAIQKVMSECQDRRECQIPVVSPVFGQDPCPETNKYIIVSYKCKPEHHRSRTVCENERLELACKNDTVLAIYSATFGHLEHDSLECPQEANTNPDIECLSPSALRRVSRKCHGRTNCSVIADAQSFGDPCFPGTRKHLRVSFTCVPRYLLEDVGRGNIDPFLLSDYTHGGWYIGPGVSRPQNIFTNSLEIFSQIQGLPETVALYFVSGICAGLLFLLCLFGLKSTLMRDLKDLVSELGDELKASHTSQGGLIDDFDDDDASLRSSFRHLTKRHYRTADMFSPEMIMTLVMEERSDEDKPEIPNGDIWPHINSSPYAMHKIKTSSA
ncbi:protein eva-1 homolog C-like isoform X1 [Myxocyprinus asiaticus]|uniref:protein eva-1 homolog C-like isoform X1 n=1 Tax=Myxocyprinus asiaticus TaxID=70543 RepID=UPI002221BDF8|nr:protein eva-1 homolog C-like isoform X1 [Myxocyprinus asiaticus]